MECPPTLAQAKGSPYQLENSTHLVSESSRLVPNLATDDISISKNRGSECSSRPSSSVHGIVPYEGKGTLKAVNKDAFIVYDEGKTVGIYISREPSPQEGGKYQMRRQGRQMSTPSASIGPQEALSLDAKTRISDIVAQDALDRFQKSAIMWTGGKDSMLALWFVQKTYKARGGSCPPLLFIDHGMHFEETWHLLDEVSKAWKLKTIVARNEDVLSHVTEPGCRIRIRQLSEKNQTEAGRTAYRKSSFPYALGNLVANHLLKTVPMNEAIQEHQLDAVVTGIRWDENEARSKERFISPRFDPPHARIHPILHFTEREVWMETLRQSLPIHPLYEQGFRSIDGRHDSHKVSDVPAWQQDLEGTFERAGRAQDKEEIMERLRELGYM